MFTEYTLAAGAANIQALGQGADGAIWYTTVHNQIVRWAPNGSSDAYAVPGITDVLQSPVAAPDGGIWFTESNSDQIGRIDAWTQHGPGGAQGGGGAGGAAGAPGANGANGAPGRNARVTCRVTKAKKRKKPPRIRCTIRLTGKTLVRARLTRGRHSYGAGHAVVRGHATVTIAARRALRPATYFVRLTFSRDGRSGTRVVQLAVTR
jgi:hypothetical protein